MQPIRDIADLMQRMDADPQVRAVVLQSQGKVFCAGADLNSPEEAAPEGDTAQGDAAPQGEGDSAE